MARRLTSGVVLVLLLAATPAPAALRDTYAEALAAMEAHEWRRAERLFRASIEIRDTEARRLPLKRLFQPYLPHYYLGAVLAQGHDCRGALVEWLLAREQQVVAAIGLGGELDERMTACSRRLERLAQLTAETEAALAGAESKADRLADPERAHLLQLGYEGGLGPLAQRLDSARAAIAEARAQAERADADQDLELADATHQLALETSLVLDGALDDLELADRRVTAERTRKRDRIAEVQELARQVGDLLRARSPLPPALRGRSQELEALLAIAAGLGEAATLEQLDGLEARLESFLRVLEQTTAPPPGTLRSGAIAYLRGDYREVLERLGEIPYRDDKARAHCLLLRSAAAFALHVAGGDDAELLERAREDVLAAREAAPELVPVASAFSPRFVRFFENVTAGVPGA